MKRMEDWYCLLYHVSVVGMYFLFFVAYSKYFPYYSLPEKVCFVLTGVVMLGWISALNVGVVFHNHVHRPIFRGRALNRWLARSWTVTCGWPSTLWEYAHLNVHHKHVLSAEDWTLPHTRNGKLESIYAFCFLHPVRYAIAFLKLFQSSDTQFWKRHPVKECAIFCGIWLLPWIWDPLMAFYLWFLPQCFGNCVVMGPGMYVQHMNCEPKSAIHPYRHSNEFHSWFFNMTSFNTGFHLIHHDRPGVHWYDLEKHHDERREELIEDDYRVLPFGFYRAAFRQELMSGSHRIQ